MVQIAGVAFTNSTGGTVDLSYRGRDGQNHTLIINDRGPSNPVDATALLMIKVALPRENTYSYSFEGYLPRGVWVSDESPYNLNLVLDRDGQTVLLYITDNQGQKVVERRP